MKHIIFLAAALMFSGLSTGALTGCSSKAKHDHSSHGDHQGDHEGDHKEGMSDCGCAEGSGHHEAGAAVAATEAKAWSLAGNPQLNAEISQEDFNKSFEAKKTQLGKKCSAAASEYCGKTTKDLAVTAEEVSCLWTKVHRVTRDTLPQLDKTPCAKMLKKMTSKK